LMSRNRLGLRTVTSTSAFLPVGFGRGPIFQRGVTG